MDENGLSSNVRMLLLAMQAQARWNAMSPAEQEAIAAEQRVSFAWGNDVEGTGTIEQMRETDAALKARES